MRLTGRAAALATVGLKRNEWEKGMPQMLVITAVGPDRPGIVEQLSAGVSNVAANIDESRMAVLGGEFAIILMVSGSAAAIDALLQSLPALEAETGLVMSAKRTTQRNPRGDRIAYRVSTVSMDQPGIVHRVTAFFAAHGINIEELSTRASPAPHTGTPMFSLDMLVEIPSESSIRKLRDAFAELCDELSVDGSIEAVR